MHILSVRGTSQVRLRQIVNDNHIQHMRAFKSYETTTVSAIGNNEKHRILYQIAISATLKLAVKM